MDENASAKITEEITINAEHNKIKRGIYRSIPFLSNQEVQVKEIEMDGAKINFDLSYYTNSVRIDFGDNSFISKGEHTYKLVYTMSNAVKPFLNYDEIYWNVTGNDWDFKIENAEFSLELPEEAEIIEDGISFYTGVGGAKDKNAYLNPNSALNTVNIKTTKPLRPKEGFTVAIPFKKGFIKLSLKETLYQYFKFYGPIVLFTILALYCLITWLLFGRDPRPDGRVLFAPPKGISPAFARFIRFRLADDISFSASLVSLAVKKKIQIKSKKKEIHLLRKSDSLEGLSKEEAYIMDNLFVTEVAILGDTYSNRLKKVVSKTNSLIRKNTWNLRISNSSFCLFPFIIVLLMHIFFLPLSLIFVELNLFAFAFVIAVLTSRWGFILFYAFFIAILQLFLSSGEILTIASIPILAIYITIIDNVSTEGKQLYLDILAFEKYMRSAEKYRAAISNPEDSAKLFADFLPYAYAFDMQSEWIDSFSKILSKSLIEHQTQDLGGTRIIHKDLLSSALNNSIREPSASRNSGSSSGRSSSGSFGGGHSGGGYGGGGGGGR